MFHARILRVQRSEKKIDLERKTQIYITCSFPSDKLGLTVFYIDVVT